MSNVIALKYIARKEKFQQAITDQGSLEVLAVYDDGKIVNTYLVNFITSVRLDSSDSFFWITTSGGKRELKVHVL